MENSLSMSFTFSKQERLHEFSLIRHVFSAGKVFSIPPFRVTWLKSTDNTDPCHKVMVSVPKALHARSTSRNMIKRRLREAYRLNKSILDEAGNQGDRKLVFCLIYTSKEILSFSAIQDKIILLLRRLKEESEKGN